MRSIGPADPQAAGEALLRSFATSIKEAEAPGQTFITADATTLRLPADR